MRGSGPRHAHSGPHALVCAARARAALHRADTAAARRELITAQRLRPLLTYALPHLAVQARIVLIRVHLALADPAGARTLMREVDQVLRHRPGLGSLAGEAAAIRAQLAAERGSAVPGASALTAAARQARSVQELPDHITSSLFRVGVILNAAIDRPGDGAVQGITQALQRLDQTIREIRDHVFSAACTGTRPLLAEPDGD